MPFFSAPRLTDDEALTSYARVLVRSGLVDESVCVREVAVAARQDAGRDDADEVARSLVAAERDALVAEAATWPPRTDYDALLEAFEALRASGFRVLTAVEDHWAATAVVRGGDPEAGDPEPAGIVWFTPPDVWHAVEHGMLELNAWHPDGANVSDGDPVCIRVVEAITAAGLEAHFDEGRIEVAMTWRRRVGE